MKLLQSNVVLITGGADGIGRGIVEYFLEQGAHVAVMDINVGKLDLLRDEVSEEIFTQQGDVASFADNQRMVAATVAHFGKIDSFIGNAALFDYFTPLHKLDNDTLSDTFDRLFHVNVLGYINGVKAVAPELKKTKGSVVLTVSNSGFYPGGGGVLYVASKHAVVGIIKQLGHELAPDIRVNGVSPGATDTAMASVDGVSDRAQPLNSIKGFHQTAANAVPLNRIAGPKDHAHLYLVLASNALSPLTTGHIIHSDGGWGVK
ncbi:SDR family NAD(P)-dependent oxidoreductase [Marinomonas algarum]|uniref:SDR family NAD(P)-dependent oxidoreductase n=1 Tax=Marinomonas algarum TaxID=2883105 RepID=A0A9X1LFJ8_9GAMM|nr:SDR family NAD(P)-dependent oxidoreductase [Marinomonas algarum]MCB5163037.1 SDR family NAD(P)-dependent oxidoreductase [Marinomonas algarum]